MQLVLGINLDTGNTVWSKLYRKTKNKNVTSDSEKCCKIAPDSNKAGQGDREGQEVVFGQEGQGRPL